MEAICDPAGFVARGTAAAEADGADAVALFARGDLAAALAATTAEIPARAAEPARALALWYVRVQSMLILQLKAEATREIATNLAVLDETSPDYPSFRARHLASAPARLSAWKLRLLLVPVRVGRINQAAIQMYYSLGFEARQEAQAGPLAAEWLAAVQLAGTYVFSALVTLRDYGTAIDLLAVHFRATRDPQHAVWLSLLHIMVGDTLGARTWTAEVPGPDRDELLNLVRFAEEDSRGGEVAALSDAYKGEVARALATLHERLAAGGERLTAAVLADRLNAAVLERILGPDAAA